MKLWLKLTEITLACTLLVLSICLGVICVWQNGRVIAAAEEQARSSLRLFCRNLESLNNAAPGASVTDLTGRSLVQYYFATYAHLLGNGAYYSLAQDGEYLYNTSPLDPKALLDAPEAEEPVSITIEADGQYYLIARSVHVLSQEYIAYLTMDVRSAYVQARDTNLFSAAMLLISALIVVCATVPAVRHALKPLGNLQKTAESIAVGEYHLRARAESNDEVASLAVSFNRMADAVESRIDELTEESERRRLLLGALAHELKTPMTAIIGFADSMLKMPLAKEQRRHSLQQILSAGQRTERMTQKLMTLLFLDREDRLERGLFPLAAFGEELSRLYPASVHFSAEGNMFADRDLMFSLVQNLVKNALYASATRVDVRMTPEMIRVADDGRGIPPEHIARLTEPFYRVDQARSRKHGGAGLGLALCRSIAEAHGGGLVIQSAVGMGTTVTVTLGNADDR